MRENAIIIASTSASSFRDFFIVVTSTKNVFIQQLKAGEHGFLLYFDLLRILYHSPQVLSISFRAHF